MRTAWVAVLCASGVAAAPLDSFLPAVPGVVASGGEIGSIEVVASVADCASACVSQPSCISFNVQDDSAFATCGIKGECYAPNTTSCPAVLGLMCYGGTFSAVEFASYGSPTTLPGTCSWARNASCDAPSSAAVVAAACINKSACSIEVGVSTFGPVSRAQGSGQLLRVLHLMPALLQDPCPGVYKFLAVKLAGSCSAPPPDVLLCQLNGYARNYSLSQVDNSSSAAYYQRIQPRNDSHVVQVRQLRSPAARALPT